jgi:peptide deformylase
MHNAPRPFAPKAFVATGRVPRLGQHVDLMVKNPHIGGRVAPTGASADQDLPMAVRPILTLPDPRLRAVADPVPVVDDEVRKLASDMLDTMYDAPGIGLAATQIGEMKRVVVMDLAKEGEPRDPIVMVNPEIIAVSDETASSEEGCLSIPEIYYDVERAAEITVRYTDLEGKTVERQAGDRFAICIQHEVDHLDGVLYIDYLSRLKRDRVLKKFEKLARRAS